MATDEEEHQNPEEEPVQQDTSLIETKVKRHNIGKVMQHVAPKWLDLTNYDFADNGRVWIVWDDRLVEVHFIKAGAQFIHCQVKNRLSTMEYALTVVYGFNAVEQRKSLWEEVKSIVQGTSMPWVIGGDFNVVLTSEDRLCGNPVSATEIHDFSECIVYAGLTELPWKGEFYTWSNKQTTGSRIYSRLDRLFGNDEWMWNWGHISTECGLPNISDHSPMLLQNSQGTRPPKSPFRFFNTWKDPATFLPIVQRHWVNRYQEGRMKMVIQEEMLRDPADTFILKEKEALFNLEKWPSLEESVMRQKARLTWITFGDANTKYFSAVIKERQHKKQLLTLTSLAGTTLWNLMIYKIKSYIFIRT
ncbi:hypothetical protein P3L10_015403 [Capsicum annuum]|uniref:uncharacterized protein LOC107871719 n=1 Tax=Capsicum annuum TaxID=4072 RepID=UPI001FB16998|nr:uncharacterized protein LOC107871719 [Capsicum annuum]